MKKSDTEKIEQIAAKINDGELDISILEQFDSQEAQKIAAALEKINAVSQSIRNHSTKKTCISVNHSWAHLKIKEKIGQGGIGEVYRAYDSVLNCDVAVKFLKQESQYYVSTEQFLQEARNMAKVRHPHVLAIHGATIDNECAGYWSDYLDGKTLIEQLEPGKLNWQNRLKYSQQLAIALLQIHKNAIVHGDIKPQNVMIQDYRGAILLDFGSSRTQKTQQTKTIQASPLAMSPEQFHGNPATKASDVFSLGLLFWQMTTGKHPIDGKDLNEIQQQTKELHKKKHQLKGNKNWQQLILNMVAPKPEQRPSMSQVVNALDEIEQKPIKQAKKTALGAILILALGLSSLSLYSYFKTTQANAQTQAVNAVLTDILLKSSPLDKGKDVLLIDVLAESENSIKNTHDLSKKQKHKLLLQLVKTYKTHNKFNKALQLTNHLLADLPLTPSTKLELYLQKAFIFTNNKQHKKAEEILTKALAIKANTARDISLKISAMTILIYAYNENEQLDKSKKLISQAKALWNKSEKRIEILAKLNLVEGFYFELTEQTQNAYNSFQQAIKNYRKFYKTDNNTDVLNARSSAAYVLTYDESTHQQGIQQLEAVIKDMQEFLGNDNTATLATRMNLALSYAEINHYEKALAAIVPYLKNVENVFGKKGGMTIAFKQEIIKIYQATDNQTAAEKLSNEIHKTK